MLKAREFKEKIIKEVNESQIPLDLVFYIMQDVSGMVKKAADEQVALEIKEREKESEVVEDAVSEE